MRRDVEGLGTPYALATLVPAFMQEDEFLVRFTAALDDVIAPAISVLDCLDAYLDPLLAPPDFVEWLAAWVGAPLDDHWDDERRRRTVLAAAALHRMRGTLEGVRAVVELATGGVVEVAEPGGTHWATSPTDDPLRAEQAPLVIRVLVPDPDLVRRQALDDLVAAAKPAHLPHRVEVVSS